MILVILKPTRIHPRWERLVAGAPAGEVDVHSLSRIRQVCMWKSHMQHVRANPRSTEYMIRLAVERLVVELPGAGIDLLCDDAAAAQIPADCRGAFEQVVGVPEKQLDRLDARLVDRLSARGYTLVVLLYRDAIGLGWSRTERSTRRLAGRHAVLNGRRRFFELDRAHRRALRLRRLLSTAWITELLLMPVVGVTTAALSLYDAVTRLAVRRGRGARAR